MAMAMAGGEANSIRVAKTSDEAAGGPEGAVGVGEGQPACGMAVVSWR